MRLAITRIRQQIIQKICNMQYFFANTHNNTRIKTGLYIRGAVARSGRSNRPGATIPGAVSDDTRSGDTQAVSDYARSDDTQTVSDDARGGDTQAVSDDARSGDTQAVSDDARSGQQGVFSAISSPCWIHRLRHSDVHGITPIQQRVFSAISSPCWIHHLRHSDVHGITSIRKGVFSAISSPCLTPSRNQATPHSIQPSQA